MKKVLLVKTELRMVDDISDEMKMYGVPSEMFIGDNEEISDREILEKRSYELDQITKGADPELYLAASEENKELLKGIMREYGSVHLEVWEAKESAFKGGNNAGYVQAVMKIRDLPWYKRLFKKYIK